MFTTNHHKRTVKERDKHLRFAHFRRPNRVAFAADRPDPGSRHGSAAEQEAEHYAHLCFVATEVGRVVAEVDGARIHGRLGLPEGGRAEFPFTPQPYPDGSIPRPTRARCRLEYTVDGQPCVAETQARLDSDGARWRIAVPRLIETGTDRVAPRHPTRHGWSFEPRGRGPVAMVGHFKVSDLSTTGAALVFSDDTDLQPGDTIAGDLVGPKGQRFRVMVELRNVHGGEGEEVGGVEFQGMGFENVARLAATLTHLPHGSLDADAEE